jgi:hypothetical protein
MVLRRSPASSRPPSPYRLIEHRHWYDVWQRPVSGYSRVLEHVSLGDRFQPVAQPSCDMIERLARRAAPAGRVVAALRAPARVVSTAYAPRPGDWRASRTEEMAVVPGSAGTLNATLNAPYTGPYELWLGGSFRREVALSARRLGVSDRGQLSHEDTWQPMGRHALHRGALDLTLAYGDADLHPGSGKPAFPLGPIALTPWNVGTRLLYRRPARATELCGRSLDWVEAVSG